MSPRSSQKQGKKFEEAFRDLLKSLIPDLGYDFIDEPAIVPSGNQPGFDVYTNWRNREGLICKWKFECKSHQSRKGKTVPKAETQGKFRDIENYLHNNDFDVYCLVSPTKEFSKEITDETIPKFNIEQRVHAALWTETQNRIRYVLELYPQIYGAIYNQKLTSRLTLHEKRVRKIFAREFFERNQQESTQKRIAETPQVFRENYIKSLKRVNSYLKEYIRSDLFSSWIRELESFTFGDPLVLIVHGTPGIGKTRFLIETMSKIKLAVNKKQVKFYFIGKKGISAGKIDLDLVKRDIPRSNTRPIILVVDDSHAVSNLRELEILISDGVIDKLVLVTWSQFAESFKATWANYIPQLLEIKPIVEKQKVENFFRKKLRLRSEIAVKHLVAICEGDPSLIVEAAILIKSGKIKDITELKRHDLIRGNWQRLLIMIHEVSKDSLIQSLRFQPYLAFVFLLRPFSIKDEELRKYIRGQVGIDDVEESTILREMESYGILERYGDTFWIYRDLLGEYLVEDTFFAETPVLDPNKALEGLL